MVDLCLLGRRDCRLVGDGRERRLNEDNDDDDDFNELIIPPFKCQFQFNKMCTFPSRSLSFLSSSF